MDKNTDKNREKMHFSLFNYFKEIDQASLILTPNRRLSASLHALYEKYQCQQGKAVWTTPLILPVNTWITQLWQDFSHQQLDSSCLLLNPSQEQLLWEKIILHNKENEQLLQITETADLAHSAWALLKQWQVDIHHPLFQSSEDYAALYHWAMEFKRICKENNWVDAASLPDVMIENLCNENLSSASKINLPTKIFTYGFTEFSPQLKRLFQVCENTGSRVGILASTALPSRDATQALPSRITLTDQEDEIQSMARWAKSLYEQSLLEKKQENTSSSSTSSCTSSCTSTSTSTSTLSGTSTRDSNNTLSTTLNSNTTISASTTIKIACVIPSLDKIRDRVLQIFSEVFSEENTYTVDIQDCPFNISAGKSLPQYPILNTALQILSLNKKNISSEAFSHFLATPFIAEAEIEGIKRAQYDKQLRSRNKTTINLEMVLGEADSLSLHKHCPLLAKRLHAFINTLDTIEKEKAGAYLSYNEWTNIFCQRLTLLGWPGERSLNSEEYQTVEAWLNLLSEFSTLDHVSPPVNYQQALHRLQKMASSTVFQAQTPTAPIQILGLLEAAGLPFDAAWVAGIDDVSWPPSPKPNPFIPKRLQGDLGMPHATAERELKFCKMMTEQFKVNTSQLIFSHAEKMDELELQASPLIRDITEINLAHLSLEDYVSPSYKIFHAKMMESLIDNQAPAILPEEKIRGGISIIKHQALCPFKSFAEWRLHAHPLETPLPGLRAKDRGNLIHKALELVWQTLQSHNTLVSLDQASLNSLIENSIEQALNELPLSHGEFREYLNLEKKRTQNLILQWLQIEKNRPPFKVLSHEKTMVWTLGPLALTMRIDRIDELHDGKKLIIDYKTGKNNEIGNWFSERPEEPQLPLYSLLDPDNTCGISFAQIYPGESCFKGVSQYEIETKGIKLITEIKKTEAKSWIEQVKQWSIHLTKLSQDFFQGKAQVDPKDAPQTCTWCELKPLCRINEEIILS